MRLKVKLKTQDNKEYLYIDQNEVQLYDEYDLKSGESVPKIILESKIIKEKDNVRYVKIDYESDGIWNLDGLIGKATWYEEAGKRAFIHGGQYKHPTKGWTSEIVYMTAYEYIEACAGIFSNTSGTNVTAKGLIKNRSKNYNLEEVFGPDQGQIFYPVLDYKGNGQEGLHRSIWFMMSYSEDEEMPVIIIK